MTRLGNCKSISSQCRRERPNAIAKSLVRFLLHLADTGILRPLSSRVVLMHTLLAGLLAAALVLLPLKAAVAEDIRMTFDETIVPFVLTDIDAGIQVDLVREALAYKGYTLVPVYVPAKRVMHELRIDGVDAASSGSYDPSTEQGYFYGEAPFSYKNAIFSLESRDLAIDAPEDLDGLRVATFQNAILLWPEWLDRVDEQDNYIEVADQSLQPRMLERGRVDAVVADQTIFAYYQKLLEEKSGRKLEPTRAFSFTDPVSFPPVFKSEKLRDDFNEGLQHLKDSGRFDEIFDNYLN